MTIAVSAITGLLWGILEAYLTREVSGSHAWLAAPSGLLIGVFIYLLSRRFYRKSIWHIIPVSIASTFIAVALFGLFLGSADLTRDIPNRIGWAVVVQGMTTCLWGLILVPLYWGLFLLAFGNHVLLRFLDRRNAEQSPAGDVPKVVTEE